MSWCLHFDDETLHQEIAHKVNSIVVKIKFARAKDLLEAINFSNCSYDIPWEDLNDELVISDLIKKDFITDNEAAFILNRAYVAIEE